MPHKHTQTKLTVFARHEAIATAIIDIGVSVASLGPAIGSAEDFERRNNETLLKDAEAIFELLGEHLPETTYQHLSYIFRCQGT